MSGLKDFTSEIKGYTESIGAKINSNYPKDSYFQPAFIISYKWVNFGFTLSFNATESDVSAKTDYYNFRFNTFITSISPGIIGEVNLNPNNRLKIIYYTGFGRLFTKYRINEYYERNQHIYFDNEYLYKSKQYYYEPGIKASYPIYAVYIEAYFGYFKQFGKETLRNEQNNALYTVYKELQPDWSGLRYGLSLYIKLNKK